MDQRKIMMVFLLLYSIRVSSQHYRERYSNFHIDCGALNATISTDGSSTYWQTDEQFISTGENKLLSTNHKPVQLNTLRFFPKGGESCYELLFYGAYEKFLFRAGFLYGNYDGLSKPPSFRLEIDGNLWANVTTSMSEEPVYHEVLYIAKRDEAKVCLVRSGDDEVPFISSLAGTVIYDGSYDFMDNNTALYLHSRTNYGANKTVEQSIGFLEEAYDRIWKSKKLPNYRNIHTAYIPPGYLDTENEPPWLVMAYAIQAQNLTDSIYLSVDLFPGKALQAYFVLYFMDPVSPRPSNQTSRVEIYVDNIKLAATDIPSYGRTHLDMCHVVTLFDVPVVGSANVTISPGKGSTLAPLLNAMEVYSAIDVSKAPVHLLYFAVIFVWCSCFLLLTVFS